MSEYKNLLKNTGIFAIANFSSKILVFLLVPLYTRTLTTYQYGFYDLTYSTVQLFLPILTLNISEATMRYLMKKAIDHEAVFTIGAANTLLGSILFGVGILINDIFSISQLTSEYGFYIWLLFVCYSFNNLFIQFSKGIEKIKEMAISGVIGTLATVVFNLIFLVVLNWKLEGFFIANIMGFFVPSMYLVFKLNFLGYLSKKIDRDLQKKMYMFSVPLILNTLGWWVNNTSDRYIVTAIVGIGSNGLISVAYKIPQILSTISTIFIQAWQISAIREQESKKNGSFTSDLFLYYNLLLFLVASVLILFNKSISHVLFGIDFYQAWKYVPFLIISSVLNASSGYVGAILSAVMKSKEMAKSAIYGMVVNILLNIILTILIGAQGITIATTISSYIIYYVRKQSCVDIISIDVQKKVNFLWIILIIESIVSLYTDFWIISVMLILAILILFREKLLLLFVNGVEYFKKNI